MSRKSDFDKQLEKRIYNLSTRKEKIYSKVGDIDSDKVKSDFGQEALGIMRDIMDNATQSNEDELSEKITRIKQLKTFIKDANLGKREQKELLTLAEKIHKALTKDADLKRKLFIKSAAALEGLLERSKGVASIMFDDELVDDLLEKTSLAGKFMADRVREKIRKHQEKKAIMKQDAQAMLNKTKTAPRTKPPRPEAPVRAPSGSPGGISPMVFHEQSGYGASALGLGGTSSHLLETLSQDVKQILNILKSSHASNDEKEEARLDAIEEKAERVEKDKQKIKKEVIHTQKDNSLLSKLSGMMGGIGSMLGSLVSLPGAIVGLTAAVAYLTSEMGKEFTENWMGNHLVGGEQEKFRKSLKNDFEDAGLTEEWWEFNDDRDEKIKIVGEKKLKELRDKRENSLKALKDRMSRDPDNWQRSLEYMGYKKDSEDVERLTREFTNVTELAKNPTQPNLAGIKANKAQFEEQTRALTDLTKAIEESKITNEATKKTQEQLKTSLKNLDGAVKSNTSALEKEETENNLNKFKGIFSTASSINDGAVKETRRDLGKSREPYEVGGGDTPPDATMRMPYSLNSSSGGAFRNMLSSYGASSSNMTMGPKNPKSGLKIKPAGKNGPNADGFAYPGVYGFAQMLQSRVPGSEFKYFSAFNDAWHRRKRSPNNTHVRGLAFDAKFNTMPQLLKGINLARQIVRETGANAKVEQHKDAEGPGYHLHFQFNSPQDAKEFYKKFYGIGGYETPTNQESTIGTDPAAQASTAQNAGREISMGTGTPLNLSTDSIKPIGFGLRSVSGASGTAPFSAAARSIDPSINRRKPSFRPLLPPDTAPMSPAAAYPNLSRLANPSSAAPKSISYSKPGTLFGALVSD